MMEMLCKRYTRDRNSITETVMIGYMPILQDPTDGQIVSFQLTEFYDSEFDKCKWKQTDLLKGKVVRANSLETIPMSVKATERRHIENLLSLGYTFLDEVQVNAKSMAVVSDTINSDVGSPSDFQLNWLLTSPVAISSDRALLRGFITGVFTVGASKLGFEISRNEDSKQDIPDVLIRTGEGYELLANSSASENTICPTMLDGAGAISAADGYIPLLMLLHLQRRFEQEFYTHDENRLVKFCDEKGELFVYDGFDSLEGIILSFGWNYDEVRTAAEAIGLVAERFKLQNIETEMDDSYF